MRFFFWVAAGAIGILVIGGIAFFTLGSGGTSQGLQITFSTPVRVLIGTPFEVKITVKNNSRNILRKAKLSLELPKEIAFVSDGVDRRIEARELGDLGVQGSTEGTFTIVAAAGENSIKEIKAVVSYLPTEGDSRFERNAVTNIEVGGSSIAMDLSMPQKVFGGEEFEVKLSYQNVSEGDVEDVRLRFEFPPTFQYKSASLEPAAGGASTWELGDLRQRSEGSIIIRGSLSGPEKTLYEFKGHLEKRLGGRTYAISEKSGQIEILESPLALSITANGSPYSLARRGANISYAIKYTNNTEVGLRDVIIKARIIGEMVDLQEIRSKGVFRSIDNTIIWTAANEPGLDVLLPNSTGEVSLSVGLRDTYPIERLSDKHFVVRLEAEIESPTVPPFVNAERTVGVAQLTTKVVGDFAFDQKAYFRDAASGILNKGPFPPKADNPTQFTVHWQVKNYSNDLRDLEVRAFLGGNVRFTGEVKSTNGILPSYNNRTQEIVWSVPDVPATKGILDAPLETIFQVELTPSTNQINTSPILVRSTEALAVDAFTGVALERKVDQVTTKLPDDSTVSSGEGAVIP